MALIRLNNQSISSVTALPSGIDTGKVLQVVHSSDTDGRTVTTSGSYSTAFSANITPTSASNKILCWFTGNIMSKRDGDQLNVYIRVGRTISGGSFVQLDSGDSGHSDNQDLRQHLRYINHPASAQLATDFVFMELDNPSTTSEITYEIQHKLPGGIESVATGGSSIVMMEIAS